MAKARVEDFSSYDEEDREGESDGDMDSEGELNSE